MLKEILKTINSFLEQGYASAKEKEVLATDIAKLKDADQAAVGDDAEKVSDLPEEKPEDSPEDPKEDDDEELDGEVEKGIKSLFAREGAKLAKEVKSDIKEYMDEQKELANKKAGIYHPELQGKRKELSSYMRKLAQALYAGDTALLKEMTTDATGTPFAGYAVDSELSAEIRHLTTEYGVARREMETIQLTKNSYKANNLATDVTTYWVDEGAVISSTQAVLGQETLELVKLGAIVTLTSELLEDEEIDLVSFLASRVAEGFAQAEDEAFFKGTGAAGFGGFTGLLIADDVNEEVMAGMTFGSIDADDLINMVDKTPQGAINGSKYYMHRTIMSFIRKLKDNDSAYIYQPIHASGPATVWSYPVVLVEAMPAKTDTAADTSFVLFGNLRKACILGFKGGIKASRFDAGVVRNVAANADINLITTDREAVRWVERVGYIRIIPTAVTKLTTAAASA